MLPVPDDLRRRLQQNDQAHVLAYWDRLDDAERRELLAQIESVDIAGLARCGRSGTRRRPRAGRHRARPPSSPTTTRAWRSAGRSARRPCARGEVAVLLVAGGQGSRLGFDHPKGMYPVGPVTRKSLFQIHAEKVLALSRRYGKPIPLLIMTSRRDARRDGRLLRGTRLFRPAARGRVLLPAGHDAGARPRHGPAAARSAGPAVPQPRRPRRHAHGPGRSPACSTGSPGAASARCSTSRWTTRWCASPTRSSSASTSTPAPRCRAGPSPRTARRRRWACLAPGRRPVHHRRVFGPQRRAGARDRRGRPAPLLGRQPGHPHLLGRVPGAHDRRPGQAAAPPRPQEGAPHRRRADRPKAENALKFERFIFDVLPAGRALDRRRVAAGRRVRPAQERDRGRLARHDRGRPERAGRRLGRRRGRRGARTPRAPGLPPGGRPAVRARRGGVPGASSTRRRRSRGRRTGGEKGLRRTVPSANVSPVQDARPCRPARSARSAASR